MYTRAELRPVAIKTWGYNKVSNEHLNNIVNRLQRPTLNTDAYHSDLYHIQRSPFRSPAAICRKATSEIDAVQLAQMKRRPVTPQVLQKIVRRLQRPTISKMAAEGNISPEYELNIPSQRPKTASETSKIVERIRRPTTASNSKRYDECLLCEELEKSGTFPIKLAQHLNKKPDKEKALPKGGLEEIMQRVRSPTYSGRIGRSRFRQEDTSVVETPLLTALSRSESVDEITGKMHKQPFVVPMFSKRTPLATQYFVY